MIVLDKEQGGASLHANFVTVMKGFFIFALVLLSGCDEQKSVAVSKGSSTHAIVGRLARATQPAPGQTRAVAYLILENNSAVDLKITDVRTTIAGSAQVHRHSYDNGMMNMRPVSHARVPAKGQLAFEPGGYHIMLMDLVHPLSVGEQFELLFEFDTGSSVVVPVTVESP